MASGTGGGTALSIPSLAAIAVGVVVVGAAAFFGLRDDAPVPEDVAVTATPAEPETTESEDTAASAEAEDPAPSAEEDLAETAPEVTPPSFDQIRVAPDGATVVAGQAPPGSEVTLLLDGEDIATAQSSGAGDFAAILSIAPSDQPRIMSLLAVTPDGSELASEETVIIAPFEVPEDEGVAVAATDEATERDTIELAEAETTDAQTAPEPVSDPGAGAGDEAADADTAANDVAEQDDPAEGGTADTGDVSEATEIEVAEGNVAEDASPGTATETDAETGEEAATDVATAPEADEGSVTTTETSAEADTETGSEPLATAAAEDEPASTAEAETAAAPEPADTAPAIVVASPEGVRVVQGGTPDAQTDIQIDAITYTLEGDVALSGRGASDRQVQILLNNTPIQMGEIGPEGQWSLELPDVDPGTYTLSVTQLSPDGEVEARVDTPFLREDPARVAASPMRVAEGVSVITVQPGFTLWGIAEANFGDGIAYVQIFQENRDSIRDPDLIFPGQIFQLPDLPREADEE